MRNLLTICAALVVVLGIVSTNLWQELRSARQQIVDLEGQLTEARTAVVQAAPVLPPPAQTPSAPAPVQPPPAPVEAPPAPPAAVHVPESTLPPPPAPVTLVLAVPAAPERPLGMPTLTAPLAASTPAEQRDEALAQSDRTATSRVSAWNTVLNLTPDQLGVLTSTTADELRRETEESLQIMSGAGSMDRLSAARLKVETVARQYATLQRIQERMVPHLTPEQGTRMGAMFDSWLRTNMARARVEEQAVLNGQ